jgi:hypothetical protein
MSESVSTYAHLATANDTYSLGSATGGAILEAVIINTAVASAVVTVYNGTSTSGAVVGVIDASTAPRTIRYDCLRLSQGLFVKLTAGNADVTVVAR